MQFAYVVCICVRVMGDEYYVFHIDHITFSPSHETYEVVNNRSTS